MIYSTEIKEMCPVMQGVHHGAAPIPEEGKYSRHRLVRTPAGSMQAVAQR